MRLPTPHCRLRRLVRTARVTSGAATALQQYTQMATLACAAGGSITRSAMMDWIHRSVSSASRKLAYHSKCAKQRRKSTASHLWPLWWRSSSTACSRCWNNSAAMSGWSVSMLRTLTTRPYAASSSAVLARLKSAGTSDTKASMRLFLPPGFW
eukprot:scaffold517_cov255-Pinguiococcus_pyrenoidosus.AAC.16